MAKGFKLGDKPGVDPVDAGIMALVQVHGVNNNLDEALGAAPALSKTPPPLTATKPGAATTPPPAARQDPPLTATPPATTPVTPPPAGQSGAGPMGFFSGKKPEAQAPAAPPPEAALPAPATPPAAPPPIVPVAATPPKPSEKPPEKPKLPKEIQDIIEAAAKNSKKALFKDENDDIDAAE